MTSLSFEFPYMEIHCSSFPQPHQLTSSSPGSVGSHPASSMFSILTALFVCSSLVCVWIDLPHLCWCHMHPLSHLASSLCVLSYVFVHVRHTHTPFASSSPGSVDHLPSSICMSVHTFILPHLSSLYSHPPLSLLISRQWTFLVSYQC